MGGRGASGSKGGAGGISQNRVRESGNAIMLRFRGDGNEHSITLDEKGKIIASKTGTNDTIEYSSSEIEKMENAQLFIHNHPSGSSFSISDLIFARQAKLKNIRVVSDDWTYDLQPEKGGSWSSRLGSELKVEIDRLLPKYQKRYDYLRVPLLDKEAAKIAWQEHSHAAMRNIANKFSLVYIRTKNTSYWKENYK